MGVHGLWPLLHPVARPVALETMGGKKLAIDSSIWLYQFQIAMRDKDGRALDNAHILGFLRRICKLLFYGIKPVFVFDGGAPLIKKIAISNRKNRKQGAKESAARTAEKLLAAQLRAAAVAQAQKDTQARQREEVAAQENDNYLDEEYGIAPLGAPVRTRPRNRSSPPVNNTTNGQPAEEITPPKKKKYVHRDQYALPAIDEPLANRAQQSDPRIATEAELRSFIEDMRPEDFDMDSEFFANLPIEVKYEIIGDLRIKSRQSNYRRVQAMKQAPTPLDFSKAQILGLSRRNNVTQKLLTLTDSLSRVQPLPSARIAGERNKEYVLIKNDDPSAGGAGYILGIREDGRSASSPVKIDTTTSEESDQDKATTDEEFEQVDIPKIAAQRSPSPDVQHRRDMAIEAIKQRYSPIKPKQTNDAYSQYIDDVPTLPPQQPLFLDAESENPGLPEDVFSQIKSAIRQADEEEDVQKAIEASKTDMQPLQNDSDADDSDVSFDEISPGPSKSPEKPIEVSVPRAPRLPYTAKQAAATSSIQPKPLSVEPSKANDNVQTEASIPVPSTTLPPAASRPVNPAPAPIHISSSDDEAQTAQPKRKPSLSIDVPPAGYRPPSPEKEQIREARPDLTDKQAKRDRSPQLVKEKEGIIQRDYAQQPKSPPTPISKSASPAPEPVKVTVIGPTLMNRTLSSSSQISREASPEMDFEMPDASEILAWNGSSADHHAVTAGSMLLDEEPVESPKEEEPPAAELDKGDLQAEVTQGPVESMLNEEASGHQTRVESPEVFFEWSPSPEPVLRKRQDATLLPEDDPNYIPPDIFPDPEEDLQDADEDDRVHVASLTSEQKEYAKFLSELKNKDLDEMESEVQNELRYLNEQNKKDKKMADDITQQMAKDIQTMLRTLGLPYVIAPMEAEAQCAELLSRSLVDGVITDDNDVFLFGATRVYKNMFNQNKYVECYLASDIDRELALDREKLIRLAQFLGSDYCDGLPGVGPVLGMELMAEFPGSNGLQEFRNWWLRVQRGRDTAADSETAFKRKFKKSKRDLFVDESWPNPEVAKAYLFPQVDDSDEAFAWGIPDLDAMRDFCKDSLGWGPAKVDELLLPIIKRMTGRAAGGAVNQATISNFFDVSGGTGRFAPMANKGYQSKRLQNVVKAWRQSQQRLQKEEADDDDEDAQLNQGSDEEQSVTSSRKRSRPPTSRRASSLKASSSKSSRSRNTPSRQSSMAGHSSDSDANFHNELEDKLAKMGVKRRREAPEGSGRVIQPAKRSKKEKARKQAKKKVERVPLFAPDDEQEQQDEGEQEQPAKKQKKKASRRAKKAVVDRSDDEYQDQ